MSASGQMAGALFFVAALSSVGAGALALPALTAVFFGAVFFGAGMAAMRVRRMADFRQSRPREMLALVALLLVAGLLPATVFYGAGRALAWGAGAALGTLSG